jgi:gas vesicle protein
MGYLSDGEEGSQATVPGATRRHAATVRTTAGGIMSTWTWILIAVAVAAGLIALTPRKKNPTNNSEGAQGTAQGTDQTANAGRDSEYSSNSGALRPLPDTQTGQPVPARQAALGSDSGIDGQPHTQLLESHEMQQILGQWKDIQADFVDGPRKAVQDADALVAEVMQRQAQTFASEREQLESQWAGGEDVSTEDLRRSLRLYRAFFDQPYAQLVESHEMQRILGQWKDIQADFVDGPRKAVQDADALVAEVMQRLAQTLTSEREQLESQWAGGDDVSTEDLRRCLRLYRAYFERLLAA